MNQCDEIRTYSDPGRAVRNIFIMFLAAIAAVLFSLLAFSTWESHYYGLTIGLIIQAIAFILLSTIYMAPGLTNSLTVVSFTKDGISCSLLGEPIKEFSWESIQQISIVKSMCGMSIGPHIRERHREYCVFSTRQLMEEEKSFTFLNASGQNSVAVIPYNEKLLKRIRSQYGELYHHALIDAPVLIDSKSENHDSATTI